MNERAVSVSELNAYIKQLVDGDGFLASAAVRGELSNYKVYPSGHHYFTLKDSESALRCDTIMVSGGKVGLQIELNPEELAGVTGAGFANLKKS